VGFRGLSTARERPNRRNEAVVRAQIALIVQAKRLLTNYLTKQTEPADLINNLPWLFGGPAQREAQRLAREALGEDFSNVACRAYWMLR
jgi:hypothetical protein